jgi:Na+/melibiose symporter-like transporter
MGQPTISRGSLALFCLPAFAIHALVVPLTTFLPEFYTNAVGLPVAAVGVAFMTIRVVDTFIDPVLGGLMDHTRTRWGQFRPWLAMSAPVLMISMYMLFEASRGVSLAYLWIWLSVAFLGFSMIVLSHLAWTATLSTDPTQRTHIFGWWQMFASVGQVCILMAPTIVSRLAPDDPAAGAHAIGWILVVLIPAAILLALVGMGERPAPAAPTQRTTAADYVRLFAQPVVLRLLGTDLMLAMAIGISSAVSLFFYMGQLHHDRATASSLVLVMYFASLFGTPLFTKVASRFGRARALQTGAICQAGVYVLVALQPADSLITSGLLMFALGLCLPIAWFLPRALMADVADASHRMFGADRTGLLYATLNGTMKLALGLSVGVSFLFLGWAGFSPAEATSPEFSLPLRFLVAGLPALLSLAAAACLHRYPERAVQAAGAPAGPDPVLQSQQAG